MGIVEGWVAIDCPFPECEDLFYKGRDLARHKIVEHGDRKRLERSEIDEAVKCANWQRLRTMMKGLSTPDKIALLQGYYDGRAGGTLCCTHNVRYIQTVNYLNALARGGQIEALSYEEHATLLLDRKIEVRTRR